jgi:hypothetical protein
VTSLAQIRQVTCGARRRSKPPPRPRRTVIARRRCEAQTDAFRAAPVT